MGRYTFGESDAAAHRLEMLAQFFNEQARPYVRRWAPENARRAVDIGCGPGFSTSMLAAALPGTHVTGLDSSEEHLARARVAFPSLCFALHDATAPLPLHADVAYARFVLSHLPDPVLTADLWADALRPGGRLLLDEVEGIETDVDVFRRYLAISDALVSSGGSRLFVGRELGAGAYRHRLLSNEAVRMAVPDAQAAAWFYPNTVTVWAESPAVQAVVSDAERLELARELAALRAANGPHSGTTWIMRRAVLEG
jgi:trans-aconitate methyltransferase